MEASEPIVLAFTESCRHEHRRKPDCVTILPDGRSLSMLTPYFRKSTVDDLLREAIEAVRTYGRPITASRGPCVEVTGVLLELSDPRARLSRSESKGRPFGALGEFCWYMSGRSDYAFIAYYLKNAYRLDEDVEPDGTIAGAYGPRLVGEDGQLERVVALLQHKPTTRKAVIQLFDAEDLRTDQRDVPCTCTLQFFVRDGRLDMMTHMRSNDVFVGLPHDAFCFTLLQEWVARRVGVDVGVYKHAVGSLHLYDKDAERAARFLGEGFQSTLSPMPPMPTSDPKGALDALLDAEAALRTELPDFARAAEHEARLNGYWGDLVRLLRAYRHWIDRDAEAIFQVRDRMDSAIYYPFLDRKARDAADRPAR